MHRIPPSYSFDVFDTVLTRTVLHPMDIFLLMQQRIPSVTVEIDPQIIRSFWGWRVWSEFVARRQSRCEDIDLDSIYTVFARLCALDDKARDALQQLELQVESETLIPIKGAVELLHDCRFRSNHGIVFVSDMYLPSAFIQSVLERHDLFHTGDRLYVSGEQGVTKGSGGLFRLLLDQLAIQPSDLTHYGDNRNADYLVPRSLGIGILKEPTRKGRGLRYARLGDSLGYLRKLIQARICIAGGNYYV